MEDYPKPVTRQCHQKILEQMNAILFCKIGLKGEIGFFCLIKYRSKKNIPVLIINNYINNEEYKDKIKIIINNKEEIIDVEDIIYKDEYNNISIIKIKNNNKNINYIEIDDKLYEKESEMLYNNESIYIIQNIKDDILVSYGKIKEINENEIIYTGNINKNPFYSLIFNLSNNKLISIHKNTSQYHNKGIFFKNIIKEYTFYPNINEVNMLVNIKKEELNKKIYFLDKEYNDSLKELNESNTELYINNRCVKYKHYFIPEKTGAYNIILKFNINLKDTSYMFAGCDKYKRY